MKTLHNSDVSGASKNVPDLKIFGDGDMWQLLSKASSESEGWMKSTKAMEINGEGCLVQITTQQRNPDGSYVVAEALQFVPNVVVVEIHDEDSGELLGRQLVSVNDLQDEDESDDDDYDDDDDDDTIESDDRI